MNIFIPLLCTKNPTVVVQLHKQNKVTVVDTVEYKLIRE